MEEQVLVLSLEWKTEELVDGENGNDEMKSGK